GAERSGNSERAPSFAVAPADPAIDFFVKPLMLRLIVHTLAGVQVQPFVPASEMENALLRIAAQKLFADDWLALGVAAFEDADVIEQCHEQLVFCGRGGDIVRALRIRHERR